VAEKTHVLILGGGFGGLYAALEFEKRRDPRFEVTVVNRELFPIPPDAAESFLCIQTQPPADSD
jgi:NADH dehydrogenase FAD-containing subunit